MDVQEISTVMIAILIAILTFIFISALICLIVICRRLKKHQSTWEWNRFDNYNKKKIRKKFKQKYQESELALALNDIGLGSTFVQILNDEQWVDDASGLIPHCLAVLRTCHSLTENLTNFAMKPMTMKGSTERLIEAAKKVPSRVDDVVRSMYPPLDARLLEARVTALVLSVGQLGLLAQTISNLPHREQLQWIDKSLTDMEDHLQVLRKAAMTIEEQNRHSIINYNSQV